jgi:hypothetical protein
VAQSTSKSSQSARKRSNGSSGNGSAPKSRSRASSGGRSTSANRSRASSGNRSRASGTTRQRSKPQSKGTLASARDTVASGAKATKDTVAEGAQNAGQAVGGAASKAKFPAAAGGAALAGLVGGMAIAARGGGRRRVLGVPVPGTRRPLVKINTPRRKAGTKDLVKAGSQMAELAAEVRLARQQLDSKGRRRSPIEVVLQGLTSRGGRPT